MSKRAPRPFTRQLAARSRERRRELAVETDLAAIGSRVRNDLVPCMSLENRTVSQLNYPKRNIRALDRGHIAEIAASIEALGFSRPVLITPDGEVIDGVAQVEAAKSMGMDEVPCVVVEGHTPAQVRMLRIASNRLGEKGAWNLEELKVELEELRIEEEPIEILGFNEQELDQILLLGSDALDPQLNSVPDVDDQAPPVSQLGDVWQLGRHRVACADATQPDSYKLLFEDGDCAARAVFTDPPYNVKIDGFAVGKGQKRHAEFVMASGEMTDEEFIAFLHGFLEALDTHLLPGAVLYLCMDWRHDLHLQKAIQAVSLELINLVVWSKGQGGMGGFYRSAHELIFVAHKRGARMINNIQLGKHGRDRTNVWTYPGANSRGSSANKALEDHPTPKPVELVADALLDVTNRDEIVLDPFLGSGTTILAAERTGRIAYGLELDPKYVDLIVRRFEAVTGSRAANVATGKTFAEAEAARRDQPEPADEAREGPNEIREEKREGRASRRRR